MDDDKNVTGEGDYLIEITGGGLFGATTELAVGSRHRLKALPEGWRGRYRLLSGPEEGRVPLTATESGEGSGGAASGGDRMASFRTAVESLDKEDGFNADGSPNLTKLNDALPEGVDDFSSDERDSFWRNLQGGAAE